MYGDRTRHSGISSRTLDLRTKLANSIETHCLRNDFADVLRRLYQMRTRKVSIPRRGPVPPVPEQLVDQRQVLARHDCLARSRVAQVVQVPPAEFRILAGRMPAMRNG